MEPVFLPDHIKIEEKWPEFGNSNAGAFMCLQLDYLDARITIFKQAFCAFESF